MAPLDRQRWNARHRERGAIAAEPETFLLAIEASLPTTGRALDLAGGSGRNGAWLAARGWNVTVADLSPVALDRARKVGADRGLAIRTLEVDLEGDPIPAGPWDLVVVCRFLHRALYRSIPGALAPGGLAAIIHPTPTHQERPPPP